MTNPTATAIANALNLSETGIFKLLVIITALLAWVLAVGAASASLLQNLHSSWNLTQSQSLTVYLPPETDAAAVESLTQSAQAIAGVGVPQVVPAESLRTQIQSHIQGISATGLPIPTVVNIPFTRPDAAQPLAQHIHTMFPEAEVDTHEALLGQVNHTVRTLQGAAGLLGGVMLALMVMLMTLTTRTGLMAESATLQLLVQLGATDATVTRTLARQIALRTGAGALVGIGAAAGVMLAAMGASPTVGTFTTATTLLAVVATPLLLPAVAVVAATLTARSILRAKTL